MPEFEPRNRSQSGLLVSPARPDREISKSTQRANLATTPQQPWGNQAAQKFAQTCPLSLPSPGLCPFGGICHACPARVQAKLKISQPGDKYEEEADQVAERVMQMSADDILRRQCSTCHTDEDEVLRPKELPGQAPSAAPQAGVPPLVHEVLRSPGRPLDPATYAFMEPRFGHDFSKVRIHNDAQAAESARAVNSEAYTIGSDVVFGAGHYVPHSSGGKFLIAHELTHSIQQLIGGFQMIQRRVIPANVSCHATGLTNPNLSGADAVRAIADADAEAITLARRAELLLDFNLLLTLAGEPVDPTFDTILREELGLTLTNPAHFRLIEQQRVRFQRVRELLESGYLRYLCRGNTVRLIGCLQDSCGGDYAFTCPSNRLVVLCQSFWNEPGERPATILHEPFHILFHMAQHAPSALRRADASCFEAFAMRLSGQPAPSTCVGHTGG